MITRSSPNGRRKSKSPPSFAEVIRAQREQINRALSIIEACRLGSDSMLATLSGEDDPDFGDALAVAHGIIREVARNLDSFAKEGAGETQ